MKMRIIVKVLGGQEVSLEVDGSEQISYVKRMVEEHLNVPFEHQRLVFKGSTLTNTSSLDDCRVLENSKLHLFVKKTLSQSSHQENQALWTELRIFLNIHFTASDTEAILLNFKEDFKSSLEKLSLDDLERIGQYHLERKAAC